MPPIYPPAPIYQKQAEVRKCDFEFLIDSSFSLEKLKLSQLKKMKVPIIPGVNDKLVEEEEPPYVYKMEPFSSQSLAEHHVPIKSIQIPSGWEQSSGTCRGCFEFNPRGNENATIAIYWDGYQVPGDMQHILKNIMKQPPHELLPSERRDFWDAFPQNKSGPDFDFDVCRTVNWNGRKVIENEGQWPKELLSRRKAGEKEYCLIYDYFGTGSAAAEIYFRASEEDYPKYIDQAKECMHTIKWAHRYR